MDLNTQAIVHAEYADHRMTIRHSAGMEYHNLEVGLAVIRSMDVEEIVSDASSVMKALDGWVDACCICQCFCVKLY